MESGTEEAQYKGHRFVIDYAAAIDISRAPGIDSKSAVSAFGAAPIRRSAVISVQGGQRCNCYSFDGFAPHLHGTHTETRQHILADPRPVTELVHEFRFFARLITVQPTPASGAGDVFTRPGDEVITREAVAEKLSRDSYSAEMLIVRTPNSLDKKTMQYGGTNPPYPHANVAALCVERGIEHVILDLPSADREEGELFFHRTFWRDPIDAAGRLIPELRGIQGQPRDHATITELAFIPDEVADGWYICFLIPFGVPGDAAPVRPILVPLTPRP